MDVDAYEFLPQTSMDERLHQLGSLEDETPQEFQMEHDIQNFLICMKLLQKNQEGPRKNVHGHLQAQQR